MKEFEYLTRDKISPYGHQRVFFTCHPEDFDICFEEISKIVLKKFDCTIWYYREEPDDENEYALRISEMQLLIIPITKNFLTEQCRTRSFDLPFALEHNIPVLPLMLTPGLDEQFAKTCGDLHYIDKNTCDTTTLTYEQKIHKFLSMTLISDELTQKIREAFYARIFLSYRKKDRILANKLMGMIHDIPFCRDIAIWFDEYLIPGQSFNDAIEKAMRDSQLFVLCVTENLAEEGNYVRTVEYPKAVELKLPIMPIVPEKMTPEKTNLLKKEYNGTPEFVDGDDAELMTTNLRMNFKDIALSERDDDPLHLYFIGLAYLNGIEVEIDHNRAVQLITQSANLGYRPATEKLAHMYRVGEGVVRNLGKALELYETLIEIFPKDGSDKDLFEAHCELLRLLLDSGPLFQYSHIECLKGHTMCILQLAMKLKLDACELFKMYSLLAFANELDEEVTDTFIAQALKYLPDAYDDDDRTQAEKAFFYSHLASMYYDRSAGMIVYNISDNPIHTQNRDQGERYIKKALEMLQKLYEKDPIKWKLHYADALYIFCSMNYSQTFHSDKILSQAMELAIGLYRELCEDNAVLYAPKLAALCRSSGVYLSYDIDIVWEKVLDLNLDLNSEDFVPGMPEQLIPTNTAQDDDLGDYDFRRMRKALSLMRYSVALYENYLAKGQDDCWIDLGESYFYLARLLHLFSNRVKHIPGDSAEEIRIKLLKDSVDGYLKMFGAIRKCSKLLAAQYPNIEPKEYPSYNIDDAADQHSEKQLLELEKIAYDRNPFMECFNFAADLLDNGFDMEAMQLHGEMYHFFKEVYPGVNPVWALMNLYNYACGKSNIDEKLSLLLEFDESKEETIRSIWQGKGALFDHYYEIARCYMEKGNSCTADKYYAKAKNTGIRLALDSKAWLNKCWASCKKEAGDFPGAEKLVWEGLECLMSMEDMPAELWNELSLEYISLLNQMGREQEANAWLNEMLID